MVTLNAKDFELEIKEFLTFDGDILNVYNDLKDIFVDGDEEESEIYNFLHHKITDDDKIEILTNLKNEYGDGYGYDSIFDEELIKKILIDWINEKFGVLI